jgi:hypothetical protein
MRTFRGAPVEGERRTMGVDARRRAWGWPAMVAALTLPSACSSAWMDPTRAQRNAAQRAAPAEIHATPAHEGGGESEVPPSPSASLRVLRLRALATPRYAAQVVDWPRQLEALLDEVNRVLGPTLSARITLADTGTWVPKAGDEDLSATVDELAASDAGEGVDWVVGLVGSVPRFELSFHQLGMGRMSAKQSSYVMRRSRCDGRATLPDGPPAAIRPPGPVIEDKLFVQSGSRSSSTTTRTPCTRTMPRSLVRKASEPAAIAAATCKASVSDKLNRARSAAACSTTRSTPT